MSDRESAMIGGADQPDGGVANPHDVEELTSLVAGLSRDTASVDGAGLIDEIAVLERLVAAGSAAQLRRIALFADVEAARQRRAGVSARRVGDGVADQIALACKLSAVSAAKRVTLAKALIMQMPHTLRLLGDGEISAWVATIMANETSVLTPEHRREVDAQLAKDLPTLSPRLVEAAARRSGIALDPSSAVRRGRHARTDRRVSIRPAPDTMTLLTGYLPVEHGVACWASLDRHAKTLRSTGDKRSLDQIRADTFVERLTGGNPKIPPPVEIGLTMTAAALLHGDDTPADLHGYGPIPADLGRHIAAAGALDEDAEAADSAPRASSAGVADRARVFVRRLFTDPVDHTVVTIDTKRRRFDAALARYLSYRDKSCRVPYCTAPIRHFDHIRAHHDGGATSASNGQGLCEHHNYTKELPGWRTTSEAGSPHTVVITTPNGHHYRSTAPPALGPGSGSQKDPPRPTGETGI